MFTIQNQLIIRLFYLNNNHLILKKLTNHIIPLPFIKLLFSLYIQPFLQIYRLIYYLFTAFVLLGVHFIVHYK